MKKTITKLLLTGLLCTAAWQINSAKPVQAEELSVAYAQADQDRTDSSERGQSCAYDGMLSESSGRRI